MHITHRSSVEFAGKGLVSYMYMIQTVRDDYCREQHRGWQACADIRAPEVDYGCPCDLGDLGDSGVPGGSGGPCGLGGPGSSGGPGGSGGPWEPGGQYDMGGHICQGELSAQVVRVV